MPNINVKINIQNFLKTAFSLFTNTLHVTSRGNKMNAVRNKKFSLKVQNFLTICQIRLINAQTSKNHLLSKTKETKVNIHCPLISNQYHQYYRLVGRLTSPFSIKKANASIRWNPKETSEGPPTHGWLVDWSLTALSTQRRSYRAFKVRLYKKY